MRQDLRSSMVVTLGSALILAACGERAEQSGDAEPASETPRSIFAEGEAQDGETSAAQRNLPPLNMTLSFADGTPQLTEAVRAELATIISSPQVEAGGNIVLRGHTDSEGADASNLETSRKMVEAVSVFLVEGGIAEDRITSIAFGEQNPIAPNALPDGSPNEEGRATNRRVDVTVETGRAIIREQTLIEALSEGEGIGNSSPANSAAENRPEQ